jgi:hypothetical protein
MQIFEKRSSGLGSKAVSLLTGIGLGAALMYVLDPERGKGRRSVARDKAVALANRTGRVVARRSRDLGNRAKGLASEVRSAAGFRDENGQDEPTASGSPKPQNAQTAQPAQPAQKGPTAKTAQTPGGI